MNAEVVGVWFVIPAFQEEESIANPVSEIIEAGYCVVVVDDGSSDGTSERAFNAGAVVLKHGINLGQGAALQTGITFVLDMGAKIIVTFDADGQHSLRDAVGMVRYLRSEEVDVVFGSRFLRQSDIQQIPKVRRLVLKLAVGLSRLTSRTKLTDSHCGLRVLNSKAAHAVNISHNRMAHASEIPIKVARAGFKYAEFPVTITYSDYSRKKGQRNSAAFLILWDLVTGGIKN